jgi:hypothetical protein
MSKVAPICMTLAGRCACCSMCHGPIVSDAAFTVCAGPKDALPLITYWYIRGKVSSASSRRLVESNRRSYKLSKSEAGYPQLILRSVPSYMPIGGITMRRSLPPQSCRVRRGIVKCCLLAHASENRGVSFRPLFESDPRRQDLSK